MRIWLFHRVREFVDHGVPPSGKLHDFGAEHVPNENVEAWSRIRKIDANGLVVIEGVGTVEFKDVAGDRRDNFYFLRRQQRISFLSTGLVTSATFSLPAIS